VTARQGGSLALSRIGGLGDGTSGRLRLGAGVAWTATVLPGVVEALHARFPGLDFDLISGIGDELAARLVDGKLDAIIAGGAIPALDHPDFASVFLMKLPMVAVADADASVARRRKVRMADLAAASWVGFHGDENVIGATARFMAERGLPSPRFVMRTNSPTALAVLQRGTEHVSVLIAPLARSMQERGFAVLDLAEPLWSMPVSLHCRAIVRTTPPVTAFHQLVRDAVGAFASAGRPQGG
jgi:DNA-binding transcriptional LysR family regulator